MARIVAPLIVGALALAACGSDDPSTASSPASPTSGSDTNPGSTEASAGGVDRVVTAGAVLEPTSLDILTTAGAALDQVLLDNVYETLLKHDDKGDILPGLAEVPDVSADGRTYTLSIKEGITFSNGQALTSADVLWSLEQVTKPDSASPKAEAFEAVARVTAPDAATVVIELETPNSNIPFALTQRGGAVLPAGTTDIKNSAVGTGPFTLKAWNQGTSLELVRNEDYWGPAPSIAGVTFAYFTEPNALVSAATSGDLDVAMGISTDLVEILEGDSNLVVNTGTTTGKYTLGFNNSREPLADRRVRLAIRQAIDHEGIIELNNGYGTLLGGPVPPSDPWYEDLTGIAPYDTAAAEGLLEDAGYSDGLTFEMVVPNIYPTNLSDYVASELAKVGITVNITPVEFSVWLDRVYTNADYDLTIVDHVEARDMANFANPNYYWRYDSAETQDLIARATAATDTDEATDLYRQAARKISEDSPVDWLFLAAEITASKRTVTGYPVNDTQSRFDASGITVSE